MSKIFFLFFKVILLNARLPVYNKQNLKIKQAK